MTATLIQDLPPRLDRWLCDQREITRTAARTLIDAGLVTVNGRPGKPGERIEAQDVVRVDEPVVKPFVAAPSDVTVEFAVLHEDEWLAVIDKPAGLVVHPAPGHPSGTLADGLRQRGATWSLMGGEERPGIVHRLDKDTSGLIVVAKSEAAHRALAAQLEDRTLTRVYWALAHGTFAEETGQIDAPVGRHPKHRQRMAVHRHGRAAVTDFRVMERFLAASRLDVQLRTGRTHQIRVHLAYIGHPVIGDPVYGRTPPGDARCALHARLLRFVHPADGRTRTFESEPPDDLLALRDAVRSTTR